MHHYIRFGGRDDLFAQVLADILSRDGLAALFQHLGDPLLEGLWRNGPWMAFARAFSSSENTGAPTCSIFFLYQLPSTWFGSTL